MLYESICLQSLDSKYIYMYVIVYIRLTAKWTAYGPGLEIQAILSIQGILLSIDAPNVKEQISRALGAGWAGTRMRWPTSWL